MPATTYDAANREGAAAFQQQSSPDTTTDVTFTRPKGANACFITVETTAARITFDGSDPGAANGHKWPIDAIPTLVLFRGPAIRAASTAGTASLISITWLEAV